MTDLVERMETSRPVLQADENGWTSRERHLTFENNPVIFAAYTLRDVS